VGVLTTNDWDQPHTLVPDIRRINQNFMSAVKQSTRRKGDLMP
jgi:hypothetical protein